MRVLTKPPTHTDTHTHAAHHKGAVRARARGVARVEANALLHREQALPQGHVALRGDVLRLRPAARLGGRHPLSQVRRRGAPAGLRQRDAHQAHLEHHRGARRQPRVRAQAQGPDELPGLPRLLSPPRPFSLDIPAAKVDAHLHPPAPTARRRHQELFWGEDRPVLRLARALHQVVDDGESGRPRGLDFHRRPRQQSRLARHPVLHGLYVCVDDPVPGELEARGEAHGVAVGHDRLRAGAAVPPRVRGHRLLPGEPRHRPAGEVFPSGEAEPRFALLQLRLILVHRHGGGGHHRHLLVQGLAQLAPALRKGVPWEGPNG
mmetsp:Transcript_4185/g.9990  ORF Transcript_4185/g.9990 Transcript_4185/m.9990 type:complete len:319 (-) Transcript_4185:1079-2035(-)